MTHTRTIGLALVAALALPGAALAGDYPPPAKPSTTQKPPKGPFHTLTVCKKGCKYRTIQSAVNKAKAGDTVKVKSGTYREGVTVIGSGKRYLKLVGNPGDPRRSSSTALAARAAAPERRPRRRRQQRHDRRLHGQALQRQRLLPRQRHRLPRQPPQRDARRGVRDLRLQLDRRPDGELRGVVQQRLGLLHRPDAQADDARALDRPQRQVVRQRAGLLGHEHALRDDHEVAVVQQRHRHRPQRARHREVRAAGGQRHHRQRHLLEQLQLLRGRALQAKKQATSAPYPVGVGVLLFGGRRTEVTKNRIYGNYLVGVGALKQLLLKQVDAGT